MLGNWHFTLLLKILLDTWKLLDTVIISTLPPVYIFPLGHSWNIFNPIKKKKKSNSESIDSRYLFIFLTSNSLSAGFVALLRCTCRCTAWSHMHKTLPLPFFTFTTIKNKPGWNVTPSDQCVGDISQPQQCLKAGGRCNEVLGHFCHINKDHEWWRWPCISRGCPQRCWFGFLPLTPVFP